jgi:type IV pilus assembly protein PilQ
MSGAYAEDAETPKVSETAKAQTSSQVEASYELNGPKLTRVQRLAQRDRFHAVFTISTPQEVSSDELKVPRYTVVKLDTPPRVVIDVINADISKVNAPLEPLDGPITQMSAIQIKGRIHIIGRLLFTLDQSYEHRVNVDQGLLTFEVELREQTQPTVAQLQERKGTSSDQAQIIPEPRPSTEAHETHEAHEAQKTMWRVTEIKLTSIDSEASRSGEDETHLRVRLAPEDADVKLPVPYLNDDEALSPYLILRGVRVPERLERRLDSRELSGPLRFMSILRAHPSEPNAQLIAELKRDAAYNVHYREGQDGEVLLEWVFSSVSQTHQQLAQSGSSNVGAGAPSFKGGGDRTPRAPTVRRRKKRYLGKRIKINIKDADIHNVLRFLADCGQVNIVTSDQVEGSVTLMLNQVPWDQALDIILRSKGLDMVREGNIIRVAPREAIAAERKAELEKTQIKEQLKPIMIRLITVNHANGEDMVNQVKGVLSERGTVSFDVRTNTLIIKDIEEHIDAAEDLVKRLDTQTPQVLIEARIVEVNKVNEKELGIQWGGNFRGVVGTGNATGLAFPSSVGLTGAADDPQFRSPGVPATPNFMINLPATVGVGTGGALGLSLGSVDGAFNLNVRLSAAASRGTVKIVSSPKITTLDNKQALISQGVSIPISQVSAQGVQTVFFDATLSLQVTPHVTQDGNIYLTLNAKNDTPDFQNVGSRGDPTILKKQASTQVLLQDGETTVIGGIYTSNGGYGTTEWPILSQIPIIGAFFRKESERSQRNELLIFITPRVINRLASRVNTR